MSWEKGTCRLSKQKVQLLEPPSNDEDDKKNKNIKSEKYINFMRFFSVQVDRVESLEHFPFLLLSCEPEKYVLFL